MTTKVLSKLEPKNSGAFPTHSDIHTEGGFQVRADTTDRDSIPAANRKLGMWVKLLSDDKVYTLTSGINNGDWVEVSFSTGAPVSFDSGTPENIRAYRTSLQSPIDNTKDGIVNLSSDSTGTALGAIANYVTISGGDRHNTQSISDYATIGGGVGNGSNDLYATVGGGFQNVAGAEAVTIGGGAANNASGLSSTIGGGNTNSTSGDYNTVGGGNSCSASNTASTIAGGQNNIASGDYTTIGGGQGNQALANNTTISGGVSNVINNVSATISGGATNSISADNSNICGGTNNTINAGADYSTITGGYNNQSYGNSSLVTGFEAKSDKSGQYVHSCGNNDAAPGGGSQFSRVVYFAQSVNNAVVDFKEGITNGSYTLESNRSYALKITIIATQAAGLLPEMKTFELLVATDNAGAVVVLPASPPAPVSTLGGTTYVIDYTTGTNLFTLTFQGDVGVTVRATAVIEASELLFV